MNSFSIKSRAKVNLHLAIGPKRTDGYHPLVSLFVRVDELYDQLSFFPGQKKTSIQGQFDCVEKDNLIVKAIDLFLRETKRQEHFFVKVEKRIPAKAGLGGGSSNAAAALTALNRYFDSPLSAKRIMELGAKLGSDLPFFIKDVKAALVTGRGEIVEPLSPRNDFVIKTVTPDLAISTKEAFAAFDKETEGTAFCFDRWKEIESVRAEWLKPVKEWTFRNDFYPVLRKEHPLLRREAEKLRKEGAAFVILSGSGSSFAAVFSKGASKKGDTFPKV